MAIEINRDKCIYCGACVGVCPKMAIVLEENVIRVDKEKCIDCGICEKACPMNAIKLVKDKKNR
ncbi:MAG: indolepyruvate ferredoxin oxidoreductase subunit alpha [Candidatus Micrarchaeia archaeon]